MCSTFSVRRLKLLTAENEDRWPEEADRPQSQEKAESFETRRNLAEAAESSNNMEEVRRAPAESI